LALKRQLSPGRDICVAGVDDQDHFEAISKLAKAFDDDVQGIVRIFAGGLICHPNGLVIGLGDTWLVDKKINNEIDIVRCWNVPSSAAGDANRAHFTS
jgi:hypothetical protein